MSATTTDIVIEAAHFDAVTIARTARRHKLSSEASRRFERGVDPHSPPYAAQRVGRPAGRATAAARRARSHRRRRRRRRSRRSRSASDLPAQIAGVEIAAATAVAAPRGASAARSSRPRATLHGRRRRRWRPDLTDPYDLVEEVAPARRLRPGAVRPAAGPGRRAASPRSSGCAAASGRALAGAGYVEVMTFPFVGAADFDALGLADDDPRRARAALANPLSDEEPLLRTTLLHGAAAALARNVGRAHDDVALFEIGARLPPEPEAARGADPRCRPRADAEEPTALDAAPCPSSRSTSRSCSPAGASAPAGGARAAPVELGRRGRGRAPRGRGRAVGRRRGGRRTPRAVAPGPAARVLRLRRAAGRPRRGAAPPVCRAYGVPAAHRARRARPRRADRPRHPSSSGARHSRRSRSPRRTSRSSSTSTSRRADVEAGAA